MNKRLKVLKFIIRHIIYLGLSIIVVLPLASIHEVEVTNIQAVGILFAMLTCTCTYYVVSELFVEWLFKGLEE